MADVSNVIPFRHHAGDGVVPRKFRTWIEDPQDPEAKNEAIIIDLDALGPEPRIEDFNDIPKALKDRIFAICLDGRLTHEEISHILELPEEWIDKICSEGHENVRQEKLDN